MNELKNFRKLLDEFKGVMVAIDDYIDRLPVPVGFTDLYTLLEDTNHLCGFVDCMIKFDIKLLSERERV